MKLSGLGLLLVFVTACGGKKEEPAGPRKLSKMNVSVSVDTKGRIQPTFQLFDQKMKSVSITGTYAIAITRRDGTELCKLAGEFTPADFTDTQAYRATYRDASCPAEPGADDLKVIVKVESPDKTIERTLELSARTVFENLKSPKPPTPVVPTAGSASTGSASTGSASTGSASTGSASTGSASTGSAGSARPVEAPSL